jgi:S1-C subfamily serine protease
MADEELLDAYSAAVVRVAKQVLPSVASLHVRTRRGEGGGSASVITPDGFLLTSAHVVDGAHTAEAAFADGTETTADVAGRDPLSDLAVLRARGDVPTPVVLGDAAGLQVGQLVVALGNPLGPAAVAALKPGDIVVAVAGEAIGSATNLQRWMLEEAIGRPVEITVWRNGALVDVIAVPGELSG